jgi:hypothetical protein
MPDSVLSNAEYQWGTKKGQDRNPALLLNPISYEKPIRR